MEKNYIEVETLGEYITEQRQRAISLAADARDNDRFDDFFKYMERYETLGNVAKWLNQVPWKTIYNR